MSYSTIEEYLDIRWWSMHGFERDWTKRWFSFVNVDWTRLNVAELTSRLIHIHTGIHIPQGKAQYEGAWEGWYTRLSVVH